MFPALLCVSASTIAQTAGTNLSEQPANNLLSQASRRIGIRQCLTAVDRLSTLAVRGAQQHDLLVDWDRQQPDKGPFFALMGVAYAGQSAAATITVIPQGPEACTVAAERISLAPYTCDSVARVEMPDYQRTRLMPTFNVYTRASEPGSSVTLIDSPPGCLIIRRLVQYGWKDTAASAGYPAAR